jgi:iron(III) transport system ATP-binding protein
MLSIEKLRREFTEKGSGVAGGIFGVDLAIRPGEFFTLLGPSGCGKTTTLRCIAGLEEPDAGSIALGDRVLFDRAAKINVPMQQRRIGMVFQSYAVWPHMTVFENAAYPLWFGSGRKMRAADIHARVMDILDIVGLGALADRPAPKLSGGQQQRLALARALVHGPTVLLLDEPLSNLDAALRDQMRREIRRLQIETNVTAIYVTHDQAEALAISDRIAIINQGRIEQVGDPRTIYHRPANEFVARFIGLSNVLTCHNPRRESGGLVTVSTAAGDIHGKLLNDCAACTSVIIRPETIAIAPPQPAAGDNILQGRITNVAFMGELTEYEIEIAPGTVLTARARDSGLDVGADVAIAIAPDAVKVL